MWKALVKTKLIFRDEEKAIDWDGCDYSKAGRTDKGVSAFGNVIGVRVRSGRPKKVKPGGVNGTEEDEPTGNLDTSWDHIKDELAYPRLLNRVLPPDIRVLAWCPSVPDSFSARFSCRQRRYRYLFTQPAYCPMPGTHRRSMSPLEDYPERNGWLDIAAMQDGARRFEGLHDFRNFCKANPSQQVSNFERRCIYANVEKVEDSTLGLPFLNHKSLQSMSSAQSPALYAFTAHGSAFLWHQIRHMVAVLFLIGQGLEQPGIIDELLNVEAIPEKPMYEMADSHPLILSECRFPDLMADEANGEDSLQWIYPDGQQDESATRQGAADGRYGHNGINEVLWSSWQQRKIDEALSSQLLNVVAQQRSDKNVSTSATATQPAEQPVRIFDGGNRLRQMAKYIPILQRNRVQTPELSNARYRDKVERRRAAPSADGVDDEAVVGADE